MTALKKQKLLLTKNLKKANKKLDKKIKELKESKKAAKEECSNIPWYKKYKCIRNIAKRGELDVAIGALESAKLGVAGGQAVSKLAVSAGKLADLKKDAKGLLKAGLKAIDGVIDGVISITEISGHTSAEALKEGKMPLITIKFELFGFKKELKDVQFDFNDPKGSMEDIAHKIVKLIK
jgi:hypothetical protein